MLKLVVGTIIGLIIGADIVCLGVLLPMFESFEHDYLDCLTDIKEFVWCIFQWQIFTWKNTESSINTAGRIILVILMTIFALPYNILFLIVLIIGEIIRFVIWCFMKCFRKMEKTND